MELFRPSLVSQVVAKENVLNFNFLGFFNAILAIVASLLMALGQKFEITAWQYIIFATISFIGNQLFFAFSNDKIALYIGSFVTMGYYCLIPSLRKLLTDNVDPSLFGSLYAIPALIEGTGFPLGVIIYNSAFQGFQFTISI